MPASVLTSLPVADDAVPAEWLVGLSKFAVPFGSFLRSGLQAGETMLINGASGYFGSAAVVLALIGCVKSCGSRLRSRGADNARCRCWPVRRNCRVERWSIERLRGADRGSKRSSRPRIRYCRAC
jgi:hypothetical protein